SMRHARRHLDLDRARARRDLLGADDRVRRSRRSPFRDGLRERARRAARLGLTVAAGLFELRKEPITGWWVATVVDRAFHRDRFARAAEPVDDAGDCQNCRLPVGDGIRLRTLKDYA